MSERTSSRVECPVCGEEFDPTAAGGWCTNSECGEWRYEGADTTDDGEQVQSGSSDESGASDQSAPSEDADPTPAIRRVSDADTADGPVEDPAEAAEGGDAEATGDADATDDGEPARTAAETASDTASEQADDASAEELECPDCGTDVDTDANFCPACGADVSDLEPGSEDEELTECPACGSDVDPADNFCASCGEDLDTHRGTDELTECPDCGADVDEDDAFCAACGENLDAHRGSDESEEVDAGSTAGSGTGASGEQAAEDDSDSTAPESTPAAEEGPEQLVLEARGESITVADGDEVGREVRRIVTETGGDEDDAVRIHREHVRFEREDGQFHVVDLGRNPTTLNDARMEEGDRMPVEPGDELGLSGVVTLAVRAP